MSNSHITGSLPPHAGEGVPVVVKLMIRKFANTRDATNNISRCSIIESLPPRAGEG
jgi:hypothetical protein